MADVILWIFFSFEILLSPQHFFLKSEVRDRYILQTFFWKEGDNLLVEEGMWESVRLGGSGEKWLLGSERACKTVQPL